MKNSILFPFLILTLAWAVSPHGLTQEISLAKCQKLKDKIDHYTNLRRAGGSASRMDKWKRARGQREEDFNRHECWRYRGELR